MLPHAGRGGPCASYKRRGNIEQMARNLREGIVVGALLIHKMLALLLDVDTMQMNSLVSLSVNRSASHPS